MLRFLSILALLATTASVNAQECMTQDFTLSACLDSAGEAQQAECNACLVSVANNPVIKGAISNFCSVADAAACESIVEDCTACGTCTAPAVEKGECEIDLARSEYSSQTTSSILYKLGTPTLPPVTIPPATAPVPPPSLPPVTAICPTESTELQTCMSSAGASVPEITACENCVELIAEFAGPITGEDCMEADTAACAAFVDHCECAGCSSQTVALGECSVDFERSASGSDCPDFSCSDSGPTVTPGTPTMAPTNSGGRGVAAAGMACATAMIMMVALVVA
ncbi:MAG: hypothetical protein SGARI_004396 [Bacillariaceae sp.]